MTWTNADGTPWRGYAPAGPADHPRVPEGLCKTCAEPMRYEGNKLLPCESEICAGLRADRERGREAREGNTV